MTEFADVNVLDGGWHSEAPVVILDAALADEALRLGELDGLVRQALAALTLSGKAVAMVMPERETEQ